MVQTRRQKREAEKNRKIAEEKEPEQMVDGDHKLNSERQSLNIPIIPMCMLLLIIIGVIGFQRFNVSHCEMVFLDFEEKISDFHEFHGNGINILSKMLDSWAFSALNRHQMKKPLVIALVSSQRSKVLQVANVITNITASCWRKLEISEGSEHSASSLIDSIVQQFDSHPQSIVTFIHAETMPEAVHTRLLAPLSTGKFVSRLPGFQSFLHSFMEQLGLSSNLSPTQTVGCQSGLFLLCFTFPEANFEFDGSLDVKIEHSQDLENSMRRIITDTTGMPEFCSRISQVILVV